VIGDWRHSDAIFIRVGIHLEKTFERKPQLQTRSFLIMYLSIASATWNSYKPLDPTTFRLSPDVQFPLTNQFIHNNPDFSILPSINS
jgi:hypothetical protein